MIKEIILNDDRWDEIVQSFSRYDIYQMSGYVKAFSGRAEGEPILLYYENDDTRGINVVMKRDISEIPCFNGVLEKNTFYDFATPYGYGGWLFEGRENADAFTEDYLSWCERNHAVSEAA